MSAPLGAEQAETSPTDQFHPALKIAPVTRWWFPGNLRVAASVRQFKPVFPMGARDRQPSRSLRRRDVERSGKPLLNWSLRTRIVLCLFFPVCLLLAGIGWIIYGTVSKALEKQMWEEVELIARALAKPVAYSFERERTNSLMDALESVFDFERVYGAYLYDLDGRLIAQAGHRRISDESTDPLAISLPEKPASGYERLSGESIFSFFVPLDDASGKPLGMLQVTRSRNEMRSALTTLQNQFVLGYSLFIAAFMLFLLFLYHYSIHRPVRKLHTCIRRIRPGKRHERVPTEGARELSELGAALNQTLDAIEAQQSKLTQKAREEGRLKRRLRNAEQLAALGEIAGSIGHEIGTPLASIDGHAQRAARKAESTESRDMLQSIRNEVARIEVFIRELLSFGEHPKKQQEPIQFEQILDEAIAQAVEKRSGNVSTRVDYDAFNHAEPSVCANPARLRLALKNIIANAFQARPDAKVRCKVTAERKELVCTIDDDGPGIPAEKREAVFTPFFTGRPGEGTGLGLALADRVIHENGGSLRAAESPEKGARFILRLPLES
ncbi:MAG: HAMP domain-containing protein [Verrucomicrobia bacterium]|jgi:signal transduction histidine kinase|nr:HAMP domain-containing protein [Verrucomicrobiota bacterium]